VLVWVGIKMLLKVDLYYVPTTVSLVVIATILGVAVIASLRPPAGRAAVRSPPPVDPPFRTATDAEMSELEPVWRRRRTGRPRTRHRPRARRRG
jgi:tellurite resistance protein TerC